MVLGEDVPLRHYHYTQTGEFTIAFIENLSDLAANYYKTHSR